MILRLSLDKLKCAYRLFPSELAEHASRDKPSALISDYVTVKRTGRGRRRFLSTHAFFFLQLLVTVHVKSLSVRQCLHITKKPSGNTIQCEN